MMRNWEPIFDFFGRRFWKASWPQSAKTNSKLPRQFLDSSEVAFQIGVCWRTSPIEEDRPPSVQRQSEKRRPSLCSLLPFPNDPAMRLHKSGQTRLSGQSLHFCRMGQGRCWTLTVFSVAAANLPIFPRANAPATALCRRLCFPTQSKS